MSTREIVAERELSDEELTGIYGGQGTTCETFQFTGVDHISFSVNPDGSIQERVFFAQSSSGIGAGSTTGS